MWINSTLTLCTFGPWAPQSFVGKRNSESDNGETEETKRQCICHLIVGQVSTAICCVLSFFRAIKKANSLLVECRTQTKTFLNNQQLHPLLSQPPDEEMMETDENKKVSVSTVPVICNSSTIWSTYNNALLLFYILRASGDLFSLLQS